MAFYLQLRPGKADWGMLRTLVWSTHITVSLSFAMQCGGYKQCCVGSAYGAHCIGNRGRTIITLVKSASAVSTCLTVVDNSCVVKTSGGTPVV